MAKTGKAAVMTHAKEPLEIREYPLVGVEKGWILASVFSSKEKAEVLFDMAHFNDRGQEIIAEAIQPVIAGDIELIIARKAAPARPGCITLPPPRIENFFLSAQGVAADPVTIRALGSNVVRQG